MTKRAKHPADFAVVAGPLDRNFSGSMARHCGQWVARYTCQTCGRKTGWLAENYLGGNPLVCFISGRSNAPFRQFAQQHIVNGGNHANS